MTTIAEEIVGLQAYKGAALCRARLALYQRAVREYLEAVDACQNKCFEDDDYDEMGYDKDGEKHPLVKALDEAEANLRLVAKEVT